MVATTRDKVAIVVFGALSCAFVLLGFFQIKGHLLGSKKVSQNVPTVDFTQASSNKDTDGDGLSDFEEQNIYKSSPYVTDSDSDGIADGEEVKKGTDPACPTGKNCFKGDYGFSFDTSAGVGANTSSTTAVDPITDVALLNGTPTPDQIRKLLIKAGAKPEALAKLSDADLLKTYQETLDGNPALQTQKQMLDLLNLKDPAKIRAMLKQAGAPDETIDQLSDEQLLQVFAEAIKAQQAQTNKK